jgi:hypothetical protein
VTDYGGNVTVVIVGIREFILAERKYGTGVMGEGNMDALGYAAFLASQRSGLVEEGATYDAWLNNVAMIAPEEDDSGEAQAPPG